MILSPSRIIASELYAAKEFVARRSVSVRTADAMILEGDRIIYETMPGDGPFDCAPARRDYYAEMARKYDRATRYPWLPIAPDPPEPEVQTPGMLMIQATTPGQPLTIR